MWFTWETQGTVSVLGANTWSDRGTHACVSHGGCLNELPTFFPCAGCTSDPETFGFLLGDNIRKMFVQHLRLDSGTCSRQTQAEFHTFSHA